MADNFLTTAVYLVHTFFGLYFGILMVRFLMQLVRADYYNPLAQGIVRITDPLIRPLRPVLPTVRRFDLATLAVAFITQLVAVVIIMSLVGGAPFAPVYIAWVLLAMFAILLDIYFIALLIMVVVSWIAPFSDHPAITLVHQLTEPVTEPIRRVIAG